MCYIRTPLNACATMHVDCFTVDATNYSVKVLYLIKQQFVGTLLAHDAAIHSVCLHEVLSCR